MVMLGSCCTRELWHLAAYSYFAGKSRLMAVGFLPLSDIQLVKFGPRERHVLMPVWHSSKSFLPVLHPQPGTCVGREPWT